MNATELMQEAADAAMENDIDKLFELHEVVNSWLQTEEETEAQRSMLNAFIQLTDKIYHG